MPKTREVDVDKLIESLHLKLQGKPLDQVNTLGVSYQIDHNPLKALEAFLACGSTAEDDAENVFIPAWLYDVLAEGFSKYLMSNLKAMNEKEYRNIDDFFGKGLKYSCFETYRISARNRIIAGKIATMQRIFSITKQQAIEVLNLSGIAINSGASQEYSRKYSVTFKTLKKLTDKAGTTMVVSSEQRNKILSQLNPDTQQFIKQHSKFYKHK